MCVYTAAFQQLQSYAKGLIVTDMSDADIYIKLFMRKISIDVWWNNAMTYPSGAV